MYAYKKKYLHKLSVREIQRNISDFDNRIETLRRSGSSALNNRKIQKYMISKFYHKAELSKREI